MDLKKSGTGVIVGRLGRRKKREELYNYTIISIDIIFKTIESC